MKHADDKDAGQLRTLEKWRTSELERAQTQHATQQRLVEERESAVEKMEQVIGESQDLAREQALDAQLITIDALTRIRQFMALQREELQQAADLLQESRRKAADTKASLTRKFEALSVVERLRSRRTNVVQRDALRKEQNQLDDQALLRTARLNKSDRSKE